MTEFFTARDGARLAFRDQERREVKEGRPQGPVLLCLSGLTRDMADFDYMLPHLPPVRLIRMDYRGRGASEWTGADSYTVQQEADDALALLDHLGVEKAVVIGTSRGGMIAMYLAYMARDRVAGVLLNDVGPELAPTGLSRIFDYLGRNPVWKTHEQAANALPQVIEGFAGVPPSRWLEEVRHHYLQTDKGLRITYDPSLRDAFIDAMKDKPANLWPFFDALTGLPLALLRGANSDLLLPDTASKMRARRPDMLYAEVPDRAHIPFLDEPASVQVIRDFLNMS